MPRKEPDLRLYEIHNLNDYKNVVNSLGNSTTDMEYAKQLNEYRKDIKKNIKMVKYNYKLIGNNGEKYGRLYAESKCYQTMPSAIRGHFCNKYYVGLDISNAHPNLINGLFKYYKINCPEMDEYCKNRNSVIEKYGIEKSFVNSICNYELFDVSDKVKIEDDFFNKIKSRVYNDLYPKLTHDYADLFRVSIENKTNKNKKNKLDPKFNLKGAFIANFLMTLENKIIMSCYETLRYEYSIDAIIHDEILIKKTENMDNVCKKLTNIVKNTNFMGIPFDFHLDFKISKYHDYEPFCNLNMDIEDVRDVDDYEEHEKTDTEIAREFLVLYKDKIFKYKNEIYCNDKNIWTNDYKTVFKKWIVSCSIVRKNGDIKRFIMPSYICNESNRINNNVMQIELMVLNEFPDDTEKYKSLDNQKDVLPYMNGYYDFKEKKFVSYEGSTKKLYNTKVVMRNYKKPENVNRAKKMIEDMFNGNQKDIDEVMSYFARAISGHVEDKLWLNMLGERNSGKGILFDSLKKCFIDFIGTFNAQDIALRQTYESAERKNGFLSNFTNCRLVISQEIPPEIKFDGTLIKTCSSGGDEVRFRESYEKVNTKKIKALMCIFGQSLPKVEPADALENLLVYNMPCKFYLKIPDDDGLKRGFEIKKADPQLKDIILNDETFADEFTEYLFSFYKNEVSNYENLKSSSQDITIDDNSEDPYRCIMNFIKDNYDITNNKNDKIDRSEFNRKIVDGVFKTATTSKIVKFMNSNGFECCAVKGRYHYRGLKKKEDEEE